MSLKYSELDYLNDSRIPPTYTCPTGYVLIDRYCELIPNMSCPPTYTMNNGICTKTSSNTMTNTLSSNTMVENNCPVGFERRGIGQTCYPIV